MLKESQAQVKRYLQDIVRGKGDTQADRRSLVMIQRALGARGGNSNALRRMIADWSDYPNEKKKKKRRNTFRFCS